MTSTIPFRSSSSASSPSITIFPSHRLNPISRAIYSGFLEHMGRAIYGGIYDPTNSNTSLLTDSSSALRKDVLNALQPLSIPLIRYPGGNFTATYHWEDGVGAPASSRPTRLNLAWGGQTESNMFGTNEFIALCRDHLRCEAFLCLNMGTGSLDEALNWIEYCNSSADSHYANLRRAHTGRAEPHAVTYWALGNEVWGDWQIAQTRSPAEYAERAVQWAKAIKLLDPDVKLVLCGKDGMSAWDYEVIRHCVQPATESDLGVTQAPLIDFVSLHMYTASEDYYENVFAPLAAERAIEATSALVDIACVENKVPAGQRRPKICFDEWNVWDPKRAVGSKGAEERYTLGDALAVGVWLNVFVRQSHIVEVACIAQTVNVISPLMTTETGVVKQTSWWVYELFCRFVKGYRIEVVLQCDRYEGSTKPEWLKGSEVGARMRCLDVSACVDTQEGWCCVSIVNLHKEQDMKTEFAGVRKGTEVEIYTVNGENVDVTNMDGEEKVKIVESKWTAEDSIVFPKHSFTMLRWKT